MQAGAIAAGLLLSGCLFAQEPFEVHGYIQGRFTDQEGTRDRLEVRRARLRVGGDPLPGISYVFQVDFAKRPYLMDAALAYRFSRSFSFAAGQMKIPFSAESVLPDNLNPPISRSRAVLSLAPGRDTGVQGRDTGVLLSGGRCRGNEPAFEYAAGVFRGQTFIYAPNVHYNAVAGRVTGRPLHGLSLGASWYGSFSAPPQLVKRREGVEAEYTRGRVRLRAEQLFGRDGTRERSGGYLLGAWRLSPNWETLARADWLATDIHRPNTRSIVYIAGLNRWLWNHVKIGFNAGAQHDQGPKGFSHVLLAQVMPYF